MRLATRHGMFAAYGILVSLLSMSTLGGLVALGRNDVTASHLVTIPLLSVALVYLDRQTIFASVRFDRALGAAIVGLGLTLRIIASMATAAGELGSGLVPETAALSLIWIGGFVLMYGRTAARRALFPLAFLGFMVPIPDIALASAVSFLKGWSAETVGVLFTLTGTPFYREGFVFTLPNVVIEIADQCSGIRSSIGLLLTSLLAGHLYLTTSWKKALLAAVVIPLAVLKNGIRIVSLSLLALHVDPTFLEGRLHHEGGIVFFVISLALLAPILALLQRSEPVKPATFQPAR